LILKLKWVNKKTKHAFRGKTRGDEKKGELISRNEKEATPA